ncbi:hypothetical protein ABMA27_016749 [Loxostege sticticalis]|uniref:Uncharacterized protein n=1 Tax=Loxostege sticticalis TaxID=481309 RepID=A0ABR3I3G2_LOXSC
MSPYLPVVLSGRTLGDWHRQLNALVEEAYKQNVDFNTLENAPEKSPLDRLFKIDLASKYQLVNYIIKTLKDEDMLYVSRALKCKWLLDPKHSDIINPTYLEQVLYPEMLTTSVNKMKQWIHMQLRDPQMSQQFYEFYIGKNDDFAMSFLWHCSNEFILREAKNLLVKLTPHQLKLMVEKCPQVAKLYFDSLSDNRDVIGKYLTNESKYYNSLKCLLKTDTDLFLDLTEKYFNMHHSPRFSSDQTKFIMKSRKNRFMEKPELYTAYILNVKTLGAHLSSDEIKDLITKLARAEYITWFSYKNVEPLLKQLQKDDRAQFKKYIFVDKLIGEKVKEWPYTIPSPPVLKPLSGELISLDEEHDPQEYRPRSDSWGDFRRKLRKRKCAKWGRVTVKSPLDKLFDRFRFQNFERTFHVLRKEILATSTIENRMHMLLVLVSKSGGREDTVQELLKWLVAQHSNEVITLRAAVVRSLVKRAAVWRVPETSWKLMLQFARGLGLDGAEPEADCTEGLQAVILRNILTSTENTLPIFEAYLRAFSTLSEYPLTTEEKQTVKQRLPAILLAAAEEKIHDDATSAASALIVKALDVLQAYSAVADSLPRILSAIKIIAQKDPASAKEPLLHLYNKHIARKHLTREIFNIIQTEASFLNALRHEPELITNEKIHQIFEKGLKLNGLLCKLTIYFSEEGGLASEFLKLVKEEMKENPRVNLVRPLAFLSGVSLVEQLKDYEDKPRKTIERRIACGLKANAHVAHPKLDLHHLGWRNAGVMAVANKVTVCSTVALPAIVEELLVWPRATRLALRLAIRGGLEASAFSSVVKSRPTVALKVALSYIRDKGDRYDPCVWDSVKRLITTIPLSSRKYLQNNLSKIGSMPNSLRVEYAMLVFEAYKRFSLDKAMPILCYIENNLPCISDEFVATTIIKELLSKKLRLEELEPEIIYDDYDYTERVCLFVRIIAKYLLLCRSEEEQKVKMENVGKPFLEILKSLESDATKKKQAIKYLDEFIAGLRYNRVYMDSSYVTCLPVLSQIADWMEETFPMRFWFEKHMRITFNMVFLKSIRQIEERDPKMFINPPKVTYDNLQKIGIVFGKNIVEDLNRIKSELFSLIEDLYWSTLKSYLNEYFQSHKKVFAKGLCKGIVEWGNDSSTYYLAQMLYEEYFTNSSDDNDDFINCMQNDPEILFFNNANFD